MVIKIYILLLILVSHEAFAASKENTWMNYQSLGEEILRSEALNSEVVKKNQEFKSRQKELEDFEYKENETESLSTQVENHLKQLEAKKYQKGFELSLNYLSFQDEADFKSATGKTNLIITNNVFCLGGAYGVSNQKYHYWLDGCAFYGKSNIGSEKNSITYKQNDVDTYGAKVSPAAGIFVSSIRSELGLKLPILYTHQKLSSPANTSIHQGSSINVLTSFYYRFPVDKWMLQLEYGKFISKDTTLWALGVAYSF